MDEPIIESMMDFSETLDQKVTKMNLQMKTLTKIKEESRKQPEDYTQLQERKFNLRKPREPKIILSVIDYESEKEQKDKRRDSVRVKTLVQQQVNTNLLFIQYSQSPRLRRRNK